LKEQNPQSGQSTAIKLMNGEIPRDLYKSLNENFYKERRRLGRLKYLSAAMMKMGKKLSKNRLTASRLF